jgi:xanthine dehydrogenase YagT iron-sulfur-binding subunit
MNRRTFVAGSTASSLALGLARPSPAATAETEPGGPYVTDVVLSVNGAEHALAIDPRVTLLDALRDRLGMTGTKKGCDQGTCGACTVLVNGRRIDSCLTLALMHAGDRITTIEGIAQTGKLHPVQAAFIDRDAFQCGYCTSGQIVSAVGLLGEGRALDRDAVREHMSGNICRCGCYPHIVDAVLDAQKAT